MFILLFQASGAFFELLAEPAYNDWLKPVTLKTAERNTNKWVDFDTRQLQGKLTTLFYFDPDHIDINDRLSRALNKAQLNPEHHQRVAVVNAKATWVPNHFLKQAILKQQSEYPHFIYLLDEDGTLMKQWGLANHANVILGISRQGQVLYHKEGKLRRSERLNYLQMMVDRIRNIN